MRHTWGSWFAGGFAVLMLVRPGAAADAQTPPADWVSLGPTGPGAYGFTEVHVSPRWPADPLVLALRGKRIVSGGGLSSRDGGLVRTRDGGRLWDLVQAPEPFTRLDLAPSSAGPPVAWAVTAAFYADIDRTVYRSATAGDDWQKVLSLPAKSAIQLGHLACFRPGRHSLRAGKVAPVSLQ
jgi:hypothetical protein